MRKITANSEELEKVEIYLKKVLANAYATGNISDFIAEHKTLEKLIVDGVIINEYIGIQILAHILGLKVESLYNRIDGIKGDINFIKVGTRYLIPLSYAISELQKRISF